ncbi:MAG: hypothetical protein ABSA47_08755 [Verrucomicrobiota bacterium]
MRNGKIAKLPRDVREDLNLRMDNGEDGRTLLEWLNSLSEVQETLQADFAGVPISRQNLCEWRLGGFREWQIQQDFVGHAFQLSENASDMAEVVDSAALPGHLVAALAARYAALLNTWDGGADPKFEQKLRPLRALAQDISLIEKTMQRARHQKNEYLQQLEDETQRAVAAVKAEALTPFWAALHRNSLTRRLAGGNKGKKADKAKRLEQAQKIATFMTSIMYDLPVTEKPKEKPVPSVPSQSAVPEPKLGRARLLPSHSAALQSAVAEPKLGRARLRPSHSAALQSVVPEPKLGRARLLPSHSPASPSAVPEPKLGRARLLPSHSAALQSAVPEPKLGRARLLPSHSAASPSAVAEPKAEPDAQADPEPPRQTQSNPVKPETEL